MTKAGCDNKLWLVTNTNSVVELMITIDIEERKKKKRDAQW
jgi:hypothetical protein